MKKLITFIIISTYTYVNTFANTLSEMNLAARLNSKADKIYYADFFTKNKIKTDDVLILKSDKSITIKYLKNVFTFSHEGNDYYFNHKKIIYDFSKNLELNHQQIASQLAVPNASSFLLDKILPTANALGLVGGIIVLSVIGLTLGAVILGEADAHIKPGVQLKGNLNECRDLLAKARSKQLTLEDLKKYKTLMDLSAKANYSYLHSSKIESVENDCQYLDPPPVADDPVANSFIKTHSVDCVNRVNLLGCQIELAAEAAQQVRNLGKEAGVNQTPRSTKKHHEIAPINEINSAAVEK